MLFFVDLNFTVSFIYSPVLFLPTKLNVTINGLCGKVLLYMFDHHKDNVFSFWSKLKLCASHCRLRPGVSEHTQTLMGDQGDVERGTARLMME